MTNFTDILATTLYSYDKTFNTNPLLLNTFQKGIPRANQVRIDSGHPLADEAESVS